jgi:hypothetical protein
MPTWQFDFRGHRRERKGGLKTKLFRFQTRGRVPTLQPGSNTDRTGDENQNENFSPVSLVNSGGTVPGAMLTEVTGTVPGRIGTHNRRVSILAGSAYALGVEGPTTFHLVRLLGRSAAGKLFKAFGGTEDVYIPVAPTEDHPLVDIIGPEKLGKLGEAFGGMTIAVPKGTVLNFKKANIIDDLLGGTMTTPEIAHKQGVTPRYVREIRAKLEACGETIRRPERPRPLHMRRRNGGSQ